MKKIYTLVLFACTCLHFNSFCQWVSDAATGGTIVCSASTSEGNKITVSDGANGAIVVFESVDYNSPQAYNDIYVQRLSSNGQIQWGTASSPKPVSIVSFSKTLETAIPDGSGGVFITWSVGRENPDSSDLYLQHINSSGNPLWAPNGIKVNQSTTNEIIAGQLISDGGTGVIVTWSESVYDSTTLLTTYAQAFAQKYNSAGIAQWTAGGVQFCTAAGFRIAGASLPDGSGGVITTFTDSRNSTQLPDDMFNNLDIYAQRLNTSGARMWTNNGVAVNTQTFNQQTIFNSLQTKSAVSDGAGGLIFLFEDYTGNNDGNANLYAQRINSSGARQWAAGGVPVCTADSTEFLAQTVSDGAGGIVAFWSDDRAGGFFAGANYAQRILAAGTASWTANGVKLFDSFGSFGNFGLDVTDDGAGNYIYTYLDFTTGTLKAQKINNSAVEQWGVDGKDVCTNPDASPFLGQIVKSDGGQAIITWVDSRNIDTNEDIYAAKLTTAGDLVGSTVSSFITAANGNWNSPATWIGGVVPLSTSDCIVRHTVAVTATTSCKSLRIEKPNGNLTVNTGVRLTILQ